MLVVVLNLLTICIVLQVCHLRGKK